MREKTTMAETTCPGKPQNAFFCTLGHPSETIHIINGKLHGDGPWKIDGHILNILGCHGTNAELANVYQQWQTYLNSAQADYPPGPLIAAIARKLGATV